MVTLGTSGVDADEVVDRFLVLAGRDGAASLGAVAGRCADDEEPVVELLVENWLRLRLS